MSFRKGSKVWVQDKELAWAEAEVVDAKDKLVSVVTSQGKKITVSREKLLPRDTDVDLGGVDDMTKLTYLSEPGVLYNLSRRYALNEIYTYTGRILIAVNPFTKLPHLYDGHMMKQYKGVQFGELSPHVFAIADTAYRAMMHDSQSQSILVSGESGSGKTEATKLIMQYLTYVGGRAATDDRNVEQQVLESNPLLEAFGNAKTVRNDNSSRFGKFVEIQFDQNGRISGAAIRTYLLERSRVVQITDPERNYHCFYQLCASEDAKKFKLDTPSTYHYLNQSKSYELDGVSNKKEYSKTRRAMEIVGICWNDQEAIFRTLAAILHLGNIEFSPGKDYDSSVIKDSKSNMHLQTAAALLMCDPDTLFATLCTRSIQTPEGSIIKALDCAAASAGRDALAKTIYAHLFDWLVETINKSVGQDLKSKIQIGVLDIYGFECFKNNSFEQFCINFANEKLQQHFNEHVFKMEQEEYKNEEINWSYIEFVDNQDVLDLIEKKPIGIISLLDEACMFPKSTHETFSNKMFQSLGSHPRVQKEKLSETDFSISHYAGKVTYQTDSFLDKNRDYIVLEHHNLLCSSSCSFISGMFSLVPEESLRSSYKFSSVASRFKQQLQTLMETLNSTEPHYIRCVKPNSLNRPHNFDNPSVLHQLRCGGVLEAIRISLAGYPTRRTYSEFVHRYGLLVLELMGRSSDEKMLTNEILQKSKLENYQLGRTKVFLRAGQLAVLDSSRNEVLDCASKLIQRRFRTFATRKEFVLARQSAITVQAYVRGSFSRLVFAKKRQVAAAMTIQKQFRTWLLRRSFLHVYSGTIVIQSFARGFIIRQRYMYIKEHRAAILIQAWWRMMKACFAFQQYRHAAIYIQSAWRQKLANRELRRLKLAANEAGALRNAKNKLEKQLEDLTWRLVLEKKLRVTSEESKVLEISKLQDKLQILKADLDANKLIAGSERDKNAMLQIKLDSTFKEMDIMQKSNIAMSKLEKENLHLKNLVASLEKRNSELENELLNARKYSDDTMEKLKDVETKCAELQQNIKSYEDKFTNIEAERQKTLSVAVYSNNSGLMNSYSENYSGAPVLPNLDQKKLHEAQTPTPTNYLVPVPRSHPGSRRARIAFDKHEENHELISRCIRENLGFKEGKPVAACVIYKCLLRWHAFEAERTAIFDFIIKEINYVIKVTNDQNTLVYWLSNTSALLCLLQRNLRSNGFLAFPHRSLGAVGINRRLFQGLNSEDGEDNLAQVDARYPAILFKQQLAACLEKIFGLIRDNLKKEVSPLLNLCIQAPKSARASRMKTSKLSSDGGVPESLNSHWDKIIDFLNSLKERLLANYVPSFFASKLVTQLFSSINIQLFNSLLLRRDCCTFSNGEYIKSGLTLLEKWIADATTEYTGTSWNNLNYIRQAVGFLVIHQKRRKSLEEIAKDLCPNLSIQQIYRICTMYWDDKYSTQSVSNEVAAEMREMVSNDSQDLASNSFLLDDDLSIPFSTEDISKTIPLMDPTNVELPELLHKFPSVEALVQRPEIPLIS